MRQRCTSSTVLREDNVAKNDDMYSCHCYGFLQSCHVRYHIPGATTGFLGGLSTQAITSMARSYGVCRRRGHASVGIYGMEGNDCPGACLRLKVRLLKGEIGETLLNGCVT